MQLPYEAADNLSLSPPGGPVVHLLPRQPPERAASFRYIPHVDGNQLTALPESLWQLTNLTTLRIDGKQLTAPPKSLRKDNGLVFRGDKVADLIAWQQAATARTEAAYQAYLANWPKGDYRAQAAAARRRAVAKADQADQAAWQQAHSAGTEAAYQAYLAEWPEGDHAVAALGRRLFHRGLRRRQQRDPTAQANSKSRIFRLLHPLNYLWASTTP